MYLSKLEIFGFKSFAQKTNVNFNEGVTAIVGPNGCGKTNIVDAIRWCLGEQRSSALRSDKMENVIFNGTASKKPMGMSEVSLSIENTKGILPTEYTDITITRRIFRSGESEYLLNKNLCRLKDIVNLFMDTGIGANAYSVIELKMVETILSNKAEERRTMFEEAAGVNKYKLRRRLALRRLDEVKSDLTRVNDIVTEVAKTVNSLERQAKKADRYNKISSTLRELEIDLAERELALFSKQAKQYQIKKDENISIKSETESELNRLSDEIKDLKQNIIQTENSLRIKRAELKEHTEKLFNVRNLISISEERKNSLEENIKRYSIEIEELNTSKSSIKKSIEEKTEALQQIDDVIKNKEASQVTFLDLVNLEKQKVDTKRNEIKKQSDTIVDKLKKLTNTENELSNIEKLLAQKNDLIGSLNNKILELTNDVAKTVGYIESLREERDEAARRLSESEENYTKQLKERKNYEQKLNTLKADEFELKGLVNNISDKIVFIENLLEKLEGFSAGTKELLNDTSWNKNEFALLANIGSAKEKYRAAIEAALKNNLNNIIVSSLNDAKNGIEYLKKNELGRASFYLSSIHLNKANSFLQSIVNFGLKRKRKKVGRSDGFIGWAIDYLDSDERWEEAFKNILNDCLIAENLERAIEIQSKYPGFKITTLDGDYVDSSGIIESGSPPKADESIFGRKQYLDGLKNQLPLKEKELIVLKNEVDDLETKIQSIDLQVLSDEGKLLVNDLANVDKQIAQFDFERNKADGEIETLHKQIKDLAKSANEVDNEKNQIAENLAKLEKIKIDSEVQRNNLESELTEFETDLNKAIAESNELKLGIERSIGEKKNLYNTISQLKENLQSTISAVEKRTADLNRANEEITATENNAGENNAKLLVLEGEGKKVLEAESVVEREYVKLQQQISDLEEQQNKARVKKETVLDEMRDAEIKLNELKLKKQNLIDHIDENYSIKLEQKSFDDLDTFNFNARTEEVHQLKQKIRGLGPINLLAYSEFEEESKRLEFLNKQKEDLLESEKDVAKTIEEINIAAQEIFMETFDRIRENFIKVFRTLFDPGDEVDLKLEENADPLEAKIEIIAKPKGKRPTSIELLSGGEKTLTAIALLFAIYLVKPSPFCILDEIDAPLDDANIDRFTRILKDFSKDTQFIVVTHNKRTMESAETMYGVTMQEEGVSKLVSVQFNEDLNLVS